METLIFDLSILLCFAALLAVLSIVLKQPIIIGYIFSGILIGPLGLGLIEHVDFIEGISHLGITLLLFLAGLCLHPQKLLGLFQKTFLITLVNSVVSFVLGFLVAVLFHFGLFESVCIGLAMMFSSTILAVKLLPTTTLHQKRMGAICISILIIQDLLAVGVLAFLRSVNLQQFHILSVLFLFLKLILLIFILIVIEYFILRKVMYKVERLHEVLFILGLAWCFGVGSVSYHMGLFFETGAFFAGVVLARHRISFFISERLKPLRDFFLVLFFFSLGAEMNILRLKDVFIPAAILSALIFLAKPWVFRKSLIFIKEKEPFSREIGFRLGQLSEFSLLIALLAFQQNRISSRAFQLIELVTILSFIFSSYYVVYHFPSPIGTSEKLNRD